jgi:hypothetical protein
MKYLKGAGKAQDEESGVRCEVGGMRPSCHIHYVMMDYENYRW